MERIFLAVALISTGVLLFFVLQTEHDSRLELDMQRTRLGKVELDLERADEVGGAALRRHAETPIRRAHPESDSISCPVCPPCG